VPCVFSVECNLVSFKLNKANEDVTKNLHNFKMESRSSF
jgi:hypothetical protein